MVCKCKKCGTKSTCCKKCVKNKCQCVKKCSKKLVKKCSKKLVKKCSKKRVKKCSKKRVKKCSKKRVKKRIKKRTKKRVEKRNNKHIKRLVKKYNQLGCSKQSGGNFKCNDALNVGAIFTGKEQNKYMNDITTPTNSSHMGGGMAINFGLGKGVDLIHSIGNTLTNSAQTWKGDAVVESSDVTIAGNRIMNDNL